VIHTIELIIMTRVGIRIKIKKQLLIWNRQVERLVATTMGSISSTFVGGSKIKNYFEVHPVWWTRVNFIETLRTHFAPIFLCQKLQSCVLDLKLFGAKISAKKPSVNCWWNWLLQINLSNGAQIYQTVMMLRFGNWCQIHQHFMRTFLSIFLHQKLQSWNVSRESCAKAFVQKNLCVKCW
jgi:hypothetical protein